MITGMTCIQAIKTALNVNTAFEKFDGEGGLLMHKLTYLACSSLGILLAGYKLHSMGLLPIKASDWISLIHPHAFNEVSGGGLPLEW